MSTSHSNHKRNDDHHQSNDNRHHPIHREGLVQFRVPDHVFYNPAMSTNRDLSIAVIETFGQHFVANSRHHRKLRIFEGLSATGIRTCRYANEISPHLIECIHANDLDLDACHSILDNLALNDIPITDRIAVTNGDCNHILSHHTMSDHERFNVIDIDPFGSAAPFLNNAFAAAADGGLLCVTCTDLSLLSSGTNHEASIRKYGAMAVGSCWIMQEHALRLVLGRMATVAQLNDCAFQPLLSMYIDYYVRIFVKVIRKNNAANLQCLQVCIFEGDMSCLLYLKVYSD